MQNPNFIVELFVKSLKLKHQITFEKDKEEYFRVLFDTYLNGQGNLNELNDYISAGVDDPAVISVLANEIIEWQGKANELRAAEQAKNTKKEIVSQPKPEVSGEGEKKDKKDEGQPRKRVKVDLTNRGKGDQGKELKEGQQVKKGLKYELQQKGKQKCKFFPFCKNTQTCQYYHPTEKCTYFPNCRFGQACLYEHEICKFKERCSKLQCPFAHPFKKSNPLEEMMKSFMTQHNPLSRNKKKPNPNKPSKNEQKPEQGSQN